MKRSAIAIASAAVLVGASAASAAMLDDVKAKGYLQCGINSADPGFAAPDDAGVYQGFDVDYCRAVAAAIFGTATDTVRYTNLTAAERFTALQSRTIDVLVRRTTWTMGRDTAQGMTFAGVNYYDGQGFMVRKSLPVTSALELDGASICVQTGTTTELNLADYFASNNMTFRPVVFERLEDANAAYAAGRCDAYTFDASGLYSSRLSLPDAADHVVLPEIISKEPLGPVVLQGDSQWFNIVKWVHYALINAEELGVTAANADEMKAGTDPSVQRLLGVTGTFGEGIGLSNDWALNVIKTVGNYGEVFDRNLGAGSRLGISRGLNALWIDGGLQYAPPIR